MIKIIAETQLTTDKKHASEFLHVDFICNLPKEWEVCTAKGLAISCTYASRCASTIR